MSRELERLHGSDHTQEKIKILKTVIEQTKPESAPWNYQDEILGLLSTISEDTIRAAESRVTEHTRFIHKVALLESDINHLREDIQTLCRLVRDGNGQPSILQRLVNTEVTLKDFAKDIDQLGTHANSILASQSRVRSQVIAGLFGVFITAVLAAASIYAALISGK